jgi:homoserine kinase
VAELLQRHFHPPHVFAHLATYRIGSAQAVDHGALGSQRDVVFKMRARGLFGPAQQRRDDLLGGDAVGQPEGEPGGAVGGFVVVVDDAGERAQIELLTKESRGALPGFLPYLDAVRSINSAAYFVAAISSGDYGRLSAAAGDFMHEPYRLPKIPGAREAIAAGKAAGAFTGWLSGSGSSVLCMTTVDDSARVGAAMSEAFMAAGVASDVRRLASDNEGLRLE